MLENKKLYCHYKQEETLQELYHNNLKLICCLSQNIHHHNILFLYSISLGSQNGNSLIVEINILYIYSNVFLDYLLASYI